MSPQLEKMFALLDESSNLIQTIYKEIFQIENLNIYQTFAGVFFKFRKMLSEMAI
jgi:hypothetical protein